MESRDFWDRCLMAYDGLTFLGDYRAGLEQAARRLDVHPGHAVLDAGSGTGNFSIRLRRTGARVLSLDFSPVALEIHREKDPSAETLVGSLEAPLPFEDDTFDRIACLSVLFSLSREGIRLALREFRRVMKPGGRLVITVMKPGRSKLGALGAHIAARFRAQGTRRFLREMRLTLPPLLRMLYYNYLMYLLARKDRYHRFSYEECRGELDRAGFNNTAYESTYGDRFHLIRTEIAAPRCAQRGPRISSVLVPA